MASTDDEETAKRTLCQLIRGVAHARKQRQLHEALFDLHQAAWPVLRRRITRGLRRYRVYGQGASLKEADDIFNDLLWRVANAAKRFRGTTDAEAEAWLGKIAKNLIKDSVKTAFKRSKRWRFLERLWREIWGHEFPPNKSEQERDDEDD
ncbi:MAG: hypothetical protein NTY19_25850 [Planctomycetota bacterium]|nr:hypothetical protein [Planctomycetota bacterium]